jgi:hypothetical protein
MVAFPQVKSPPVDTFTSFILANMTRFLRKQLAGSRGKRRAVSERSVVVPALGTIETTRQLGWLCERSATDAAMR